MGDTKNTSKGNKKVNFEENEDKIIRYPSTRSSKASHSEKPSYTYHLGLVEFSYFVVIAYDRSQEIDDATRNLFQEFRKNIRLNHVFKKLVKD